MSRLSNYFAAKNLVKLQLANADSLLGAGKVDKAMGQLIGAVKELLVAQNNLVSLAFEKRSSLKGGK